MPSAAPGRARSDASRRPSRPGACRPCRTPTRRPRERSVGQLRRRARAPRCGGRRSSSASGSARRRRRRSAPSRRRRSAGRRRTPAGPAATSSAMRSQARSRKCGFSGDGTTCVVIGERPCGQLGERRDLEVAEDGHRDGARDRRGGHDEHVRAVSSRALARQRLALLDAEAVLLVDDDEPEVEELHLVLEQRVRADRRCPPRRRRCRASPRGGARSTRDPVSSATRVPRSVPPSRPRSASGPSIAVIERWCCWASTSVGASSAAWPPESTTVSIARSATTVLPEPTSPCSSRCIGWVRARSAAIVRPTSHLAVGQRERQPRVERLEQPAWRAPRAARRAARRRRAGAARARSAARTPRPSAAARGPRARRPWSSAGGRRAARRAGPAARSARACSGGIGSSRSSGIWSSTMPDRARDLPRRHRRGRRVDRDERAGPAQHRVGAVVGGVLVDVVEHPRRGRRRQRLGRGVERVVGAAARSRGGRAGDGR